MDTDDRRRAAVRGSIEGLAHGDAFGERFFALFRPEAEARRLIAHRQLPPEPRWHWTDDTAMALDLLAVLAEHGEVRQPALVARFAATYRADPGRGYGSGMHALLPRAAAAPAEWRELAHALFGGEGSLGNGAAMRVAPLGAWFHHDLDRAADQAARSAEVTHAHPQGVAGAVAVAVAAALAARGAPLALTEIAARTPDGPVRQGLLHAAELPPGTPPEEAAATLGSGRRIRADDTVPFALWCAARHPDDLPTALWTTAAGLGDVDTTCAITGGVVAARSGTTALGEQWTSKREALPEWTTTV
ncbi:MULTISPECIES: ADP-ribosylglycohydrolase family protein [Streptomyces]|uniref:ADP-ribosylglycohydrolase family protein n=1 Tax=Streptomyces TaxID=1883 RepID=UPI0019643821|nr:MULTISPECIES: ADP-ribosylglycohydrolase family protein [Streptomyces]QRX94270.1 ADP-ribosylglycohydrolase family protein [Streptomyces noursei]UJB43986.1 ADP-ribosylglycohydrolase family protein [Streptomyces sp. A1-5]